MPVIRLNMDDDYKEFSRCSICNASHQMYRNTGKMSSQWTRTLFDYHHLNCAKCGLYVEICTTNRTTASAANSACDTIFVCSNAIPCRHCLCYECGVLYNLEISGPQQQLQQPQPQSQQLPTLRWIEKQQQSKSESEVQVAALETNKHDNDNDNNDDNPEVEQDVDDDDDDDDEEDQEDTNNEGQTSNTTINTNTNTNTSTSTSINTAPSMKFKVKLDCNDVHHDEGLSPALVC